MDLALPTDSPLADLLPTLLRFAGENPDDPTFLRGGWVLQRVGEEPLDASQRLGGLDLRDGDVLHLRHREAGIPEFAFDDVADAISTANRTKRAAWQPSDTRVASLLIGAVFFLLGAVLAMSSGPPWILPSVVVLIAAVALLLGGWSMSRAVGDSQVGALMGAAGVAYAGIGGMLVFADDAAAFAVGPAQVAVGFAFAFVAAAVAGFAIVAWWNGFFGAAAAALIGALSAVALLVLPIDAPAAAAVALSVTLASAPMMPTLCARLARLPIPQLPTSAEDLRKQTDILPGPAVLQQALTADRMMAGLLGASAGICAIASIYLAGDSGWFGPSLAGVAGLALILRARHFRGRTQRLWLMCGGVICGLLLLIRLAGGSAPMVTLFAAGLPCLVTAAALAAWAVTPDRRLSPYWGRLTDILEVLVLLSIVPLMLGVLDIYTRIREMFPG